MRIRGSTLFCLRSPARPHEVLSYSVRCKGRRPGDLLSFRPSRSGMQFSHLICIRFHYPDSLCHIQKTYSFLHRSYYGQELMFNAVSVKLMECRSGNSDEKQAACDSPCQVVDFSGYHFSHRLSLLFCIFLRYMQRVFEVFDVVSGYRNFFLGEVVHGEEEGAVVLAF